MEMKFLSVLPRIRYQYDRPCFPSGVGVSPPLRVSGSNDLNRSLYEERRLELELRGVGEYDNSKNLTKNHEGPDGSQWSRTKLSRNENKIQTNAT